MLVLVLLIAIAIGVPASAFPHINEELILDNRLQASNNVETNAADFPRAESNDSFEKYLENYIKFHDISFKLPFTDSTVTLYSRSLDSSEMDFKLNFNSDNEAQARKKSKVKKIFIPILIFILLKTIVLIPLALGILGIKTWNAIQLSFISFVSSLILAIWKLCSKINQDQPSAVIHNAWTPYAHDRSDSTQQRAYSGYTVS